MKKFALTPHSANFITGLIYLISAFASPAFGILIDKTGRNMLYVFVAIVATKVGHACLAFTYLGWVHQSSLYGLKSDLGRILSNLTGFSTELWTNLSKWVSNPIPNSRNLTNEPSTEPVRAHRPHRAGIQPAGERPLAHSRPHHPRVPAWYSVWYVRWVDFRACHVFSTFWTCL